MPPSGMRPQPGPPGQPPGQMRPPSGPRPVPVRPTGPAVARPPQTGVHPRTGQVGPAPVQNTGGGSNGKLANWIAIGGFVGLAIVFVIVVIIFLVNG